MRGKFDFNSFSNLSIKQLVSNNEVKTSSAIDPF